MHIRNRNIRAAIKEAGLYHWQVAKKIDLRETTFSHLLCGRRVTDEIKDQIYAAIEDLKKEKEANG